MTKSFFSLPSIFSYFQTLEEQLCHAVEKGHTKKVAKLIAKGADVNADMLAISGNAILQSFELQVNTNSEPTTYPVLMCAVYNGHKDVAELLLTNGADMKTAENEPSVLFTAILCGHIEITEMLLNYGADANEKIPGGATALMAAISSGHPDIAKLLIRHGADIHAKDDVGESVLDAAIYYQQKEIEDLLHAAGASNTTA